MFKKILLAVDGSNQSLKAAEYTKNLAALIKPEKITILNVGSVQTIYLMNYHPSMIEPDILPQQVEDRIKEQGEKVLQDALEIFKGANLQIKTQFQYGHPAETIADFAQKENFDLIIVGSRGLSELKGMFLGSVSDRISHLCHCPILIVK